MDEALRNSNIGTDESDAPEGDAASPSAEELRAASERAADRLAEDLAAVPEEQQGDWLGFVLARTAHGDSYDDAAAVAWEMIDAGQSLAAEVIADDSEGESGEDDSEADADEPRDDYETSALRAFDALTRLYNPNQPRAADGKWTSGGGSAGGGKSKKKAAPKAKKSAPASGGSGGSSSGGNGSGSSKPPAGPKDGNPFVRSMDGPDEGADDSAGRFREGADAGGRAVNPALRESFTQQAASLRGTFEGIVRHPLTGILGGVTAVAVGALTMGFPLVAAGVMAGSLGVAGGLITSDAVGRVWEQTEDYLSDHPGRRAKNPRIRKTQSPPLLSAAGEFDRMTRLAAAHTARTEPLVLLSTFTASAVAAAPPPPAQPGWQGYDWSPHPEGLLVHDVELISYLDPAERPDLQLPCAVDYAFLTQMASTNHLQVAKGKYPRVLLRHNGESEAPVIGRLATPVRWVEPWLVSDVLLTNPTAIGMAARGEMPSRSAEFKAHSRHLWGLAFTLGEEGHFDEELPDFRLAPKPGLEQYRQYGAGQLVA